MVIKAWPGYVEFTWEHRPGRIGRSSLGHFLQDFSPVDEIVTTASSKKMVQEAAQKAAKAANDAATERVLSIMRTELEAAASVLPGISDTCTRIMELIESRVQTSEPITEFYHD
jgi:uncharacterized protein YybS (DUF2232 family)